MKKTVYALLTVIAITFILFIHVESNHYNGVAEVCLNSCHALEETEKALEQAQIYDYLIIYDLYNKDNSKVYKGNINILLSGKIKEKTNIELSEYEVLMGDKFAEKNFAYYPLGREHESNNKQYRITAVIKDSSDIYYNDLSMLENQNIKGQRIYAVLKNKEGVNIDENTFLSILKSRNINPSASIYYDNLGKFLLKIMILCVMTISLYIIFKYMNDLKKFVRGLISGYEERKYDVGILGYIKEQENSEVVKRIVLPLGLIIISMLCVIFLTVKYINLRMPYRFNPVSPKSIYGIIKSFHDFILYYLTDGLTEMSMIMFKIVIVYFGSALIAATVYIIKKYHKRKKPE